MASTRSTTAPPVFASDASTVVPPTPIQGVTYRDPIAGPASSADGWPYGERVNSAEFNQIMFQMSSLLSVMDRKGILGWSDQVNYTEPAIVFGSDGQVYFWLATSGPAGVGARDPISQPGFWRSFNTGSLIGAPIVMNSSALYTPDPRMRSVIVESVGGGGGSSHVVATSAGQFATTGGAGAGMSAKGRFTSQEVGSGIFCTIGSAGAGASAGGGSPSTNGSATSFGTLMSVAGGSRSTPGIISTSTYLTPYGAGGAVFSGNAMFFKAGEPGTWGVYSPGSGQLGGSGGSSPFGGGGIGNGIGTASLPGTGYGAGGGGGSLGPSSPSIAGAPGSGGLIIIWEYF